MKLQDLGEDRLVERITRGLSLGPDVRVGAGDDCAVLGRPRDTLWRLLKTDAVLEGVHFEPGEKMERVGWKALCRAISDIAAMGGVPEHALTTVALPAHWDVAQLDALYRGLRRAARRYGVSIVGGETASSPGGLFVSVALTGWVERARCVLRSGGKPGDAIYVTGQLGGSRAGRHLDFQPRLEEARWLAKHFRPHAMMDVSDGLGLDLPRLARASGCGWELDEASLPRRRGCTVAQALGDGEDFELLFSGAPRQGSILAEAWRKRFPRLALTCIGRMTRTAPLPSSSTAYGYDHFA